MSSAVFGNQQGVPHLKLPLLKGRSKRSDGLSMRYVVFLEYVLFKIQQDVSEFRVLNDVDCLKQSVRRMLEYRS